MAPMTSMLGIWDDGNLSESEVTVDCLLPTGVVVQLLVRKDVTLAEIKEELWKESAKYPLYSSLKDKNFYVFMCINQRAEKEELIDESKRLCDVRPFQPVLKLVVKKGDKKETILNFQISSIIGKGLKEFDALKNSEVSDFRVRMKLLCQSIAKERDSKGWYEKAMYLYAPNIASSPEVPTHIKDRLSEQLVMVSVHVSTTNTDFKSQFPLEARPHELIDHVRYQSQHNGWDLGNADLYALKFVGRDELLIGDYALIQFLTVRKYIHKEQTVPLILALKECLMKSGPPIVPPRRAVQPPIKPRRTVRKGVSSWDLENMYTITVNMVTNLPDYSHFTKVYLRVGIYHGHETMCRTVWTQEMSPNDNYATFDAELQFDITLKNLPRMARLCFVLFTAFDKRIVKKGTTPRKVKPVKLDWVPLSWVNMPVFDYTDALRTGIHMLYMWPITDDKVLSDELLNPIGSLECNPHVDEAVGIKFSCHTYDIAPTVFYPSLETVLDVASKNKDRRNSQFNSVMQSMDPSQLGSLRAMVESDPLQILHEQDKELIWRLRYEVRYHFPNALARLISCVEWNNKIQVALMQDLLHKWDPLPAKDALELLDFNYADKAVRNFAVKCLKNISDHDLCQCLLQLVQVLKYESYIECDLVEFLLRRALANQYVGHIFFWLLRSEMHVPSVSVRYGLILEAYCHGSVSHVTSLIQQVSALDKLSQCCQAIQAEAYKNIGNPQVKVEARDEMKKLLQLPRFAEVLSDLPSILDPSIRLGKLKVDECKFMDSKKRPLWLVWENSDQIGPDLYIMYKKGDDLRQDMLTLQILRIIESLWHLEGLDLRMNAYGCLATGHEEGLIEIVLQSNTIANIQKMNAPLKLTAAFHRMGLYKWLQSKNSTPERLSKAIDEFTYSTAGYCVATYVLGIGDRHSDNIMLKENGQMFHIDFGHFLGNFKSKLGVRRERAPFVLTKDFVYIIKRGPENCDKAFANFRQLCEDAFLILRRRSNLLLSLFMMMLNTGIEQLSSIKSVHFLKSTLQPELTEEQALQKFREKFTEAVSSGWKAQLNFTAHNFAKDNS